LDVTLQFVGAIPFDEYLRQSVQKQTPVVLGFPRSKSAQAMRSIAAKIDTWPLKTQAGGYIEFFIERMVKYSQKEVA
jgi:flagellar biosynthesis protein FlhG